MVAAETDADKPFRRRLQICERAAPGFESAARELFDVGPRGPCALHYFVSSDNAEGEHDRGEELPGSGPKAPEPEEGEQGNERSRSERRSTSIGKGQRSSHGKDRKQRRKSSLRHARRSGEYYARKGDGAGNVRVIEK